jgi:hypothetical protein
MAQELRVNLPTVSFTKGTISINITPSPSPLVIDVAGENNMHDQVTLTTTFVSLNKGNITSIGWVYLKNLDLINNAQFGADGVLFPLLLKPGEFAAFRWNQAAVTAKSSAGTVNIEYMFIES